jgi:hypothetical protein
MKSFIAAATLLTAALAAPAAKRSEYDIEVTLTNDYFGRSLSRRLPSGNYPNSIKLNFDDPDFLIDGAVKASSVTLEDIKKDGKRVSCNIVSGGQAAFIDTDHTYASLRNFVGAEKEGVDLSATGATIACTVEGEVINTPKVRRSEFDLEVALYDDQHGTTVIKGVPSGNYDNSVSAIYGDSNLVWDGRIKATSIELKTNWIEEGGRSVSCWFKLGDKTVEINSDRPYADIDDIPGANVVDVTDAKLACYVEGEQIN